LRAANGSTTLAPRKHYAQWLFDSVKATLHSSMDGRQIVERVYGSLFLLFFRKRLVFVIDQVAIYPRQLQGLNANHFVFVSAFLAGNYIAFFDFVQFDV
jgi:hypothetical protein